MVVEEVSEVGVCTVELLLHLADLPLRPPDALAQLVAVPPRVVHLLPHLAPVPPHLPHVLLQHLLSHEIASTPPPSPTRRRRVLIRRRRVSPTTSLLFAFDSRPSSLQLRSVPGFHSRPARLTPTTIHFSRSHLLSKLASPVAEGGAEDIKKSDLDADTSRSQHLYSRKNSPLPAQFLEVTCKNTGKIWRFAAGTEAVFAVRMLNYKMEAGYPPALYIESVKEGEEAVVFGPNAILVNFGEGWKLQTVVGKVNQEQRSSSEVTRSIPPIVQKEADEHPKTSSAPKQTGFRGTMIYLGKMLLVFIFMFLLGGLFTYLLENLPELIAYFSYLF